VVLSACETHREVDVGTGSFSLALGFFHAGAGQVLASLWKVDEQATSLLMGRFVENLVGLRGEIGPDGALEMRDGRPMPSAEALREARDWLRGATRDEVRAATRRMGLGSTAVATRSAAEGLAGEPRTADLLPYADPYFWSGFVLLGR
jgi:CHAT domain-containing protein